VGEFIAFLVLMAIGGVIYLIQGPSPGQHLLDTNKGETLPVEFLSKRSLLGDHPVYAVLIRQSGNLYRDLGLFESGDHALVEITKSFRRAKIDDVRITHADGDSMAIYRWMYDFRGRAEGKKLAGARIVRVGDDRESWLLS